jgi:hypothetical protein
MIPKWATLIPRTWQVASGPRSRTIGGSKMKDVEIDQTKSILPGTRLIDLSAGQLL